MAYVLYQTTNLVNRKIYIGVHNNTKERYLGSGKLILKAIEKYGRQNFRRDVLAECSDPTFAYQLEAAVVNQEFVNRIDTYNLTVGGNMPPTRQNVSPSTEDRQKKRLALKGKPWTQKRQLAQTTARSLKGFAHSTETKQKMSAAATRRWAK